MEQRNITVAEIERRTGVRKQSIKYILDKNLKQSSLSFDLAEGLEVSYKWLSEGIEDNSFIMSVEVNVFNNIYVLLTFLASNELANNSEKTITDNRNIISSDFVFKDGNSFFYCSVNKDIISSQYIKIIPDKNTYTIVNSLENNFTYPIIEKKIVYVKEYK
jgi:hypothetical protein